MSETYEGTKNYEQDIRGDKKSESAVFINNSVGSEK